MLLSLLIPPRTSARVQSCGLRGRVAAVSACRTCGLRAARAGARSVPSSRESSSSWRWTGSHCSLGPSSSRNLPKKNIAKIKCPKNYVIQEHKDM